MDQEHRGSRKRTPDQEYDELRFDSPTVTLPLGHPDSAGSQLDNDDVYDDLVVATLSYEPFTMS